MKHKKDKIIQGRVALLLAAALVLTGSVFALSASINVNPSFSAGEMISFNYTILSSVQEDISYAASVSCPNAPSPAIKIENASLAPNVPFTKTYVYLSDLTNKVGPQTCTALVGILSPEQASANKSFDIATLPQINLTLNACKDSSCSNPARVFVSGDKIYFDYSSLQGASISATLGLPDGSLKTVDLSSPLEVSQTGTYTLDVNASAQGYESSEKQIQFGVISQAPQIGYSSLSTEGGSSSGKSVLGYVIFAILIIVVAASAFLFIKLLLKKRKFPNRK